jgi:isoaspartyl peptidase/L-asparaginase-like protein (Ntn-hydrolase superfamily)
VAQILEHPSSPVNPAADIIEHSKHVVGLHYAAQTLANADRCRRGLSPLPMPQLPEEEAVWYRQAARNLIEMYLKIQGDR